MLPKFIFVFTVLLLLIHQGNNAMTEEDRYVPLGHHFNFSCDAFQRIQERLLNVEEVQWSFRQQDSYVVLENDPHSRFIYDVNAHFLIGYQIQRLHAGIFECRVKYSDASRELSYIEISSIRLKLQDCNEKIDSNDSHALRNPCQYGQCEILTSKVAEIPTEKLYCSCAEQYTGLYCDVERNGTWWRETLYYSSTFGHFLFTAIIFLGFYCFTRCNSRERISLQEDVPDYGRLKSKEDYLYPAARKAKTKPLLQQPSNAAPEQQSQQQQSVKADDAAPQIPSPNEGGAQVSLPKDERPKLLTTPKTSEKSKQQRKTK